MSSYLSDEEQVERLSGFIRKYGNSILSAFLAALVAYAGWMYWQKSQSAKQAVLAEEYTAVTGDASKLLANITDQALLTKFMTSSDALIKKAPNSVYANYTLLLQAKVAIEKNDLPRAETALKKVTANSKTDDATNQIALLRLARVQAAQNKLSDALKTLTSVTEDGFDATALELKGDYLLQSKDVAGAKTAYNAAWSLLKTREEPRPLLKVKMQNLGLDVPDITVTSPIKDAAAK